MSNELSILALYGLLLLATILVQAAFASRQLSLTYLAGPRDDGVALGGVAGRALRAVDNSVVAMALFAPAVLILAAKGGFGPPTLVAAQTFLIGRLVYVVVYLAGVPWVRTLAWFAGFGATLYLYLMAL